MTQKVLILCTGNSCRSQMAEALINHDLAPAWQAVSAGTRPAGYVHPKAIVALGELGIDFVGRSKSTDEFRDQWFDAVVTVCDSANEDCPVWLQAARRLHISFPDPAKAEGTEEEVMAVFRQVRDDIRRDVAAALRSLRTNSRAVAPRGARG